MDIVEVEQLTKKYGDLTAVDQVSFSVREGEIFGFLGPNGAGKTTTINVLTGLARATSGSARISGFHCAGDIKKAQQIMGIVPDEVSNLKPSLQENFPEVVVEVPGNQLIRLRSSRPLNLTPLMRFFEERNLPVYEARIMRPSLFMVNLSGIRWLPVLGAVFLISVTSALLGLFIAVSVKEIFEAQTFSNFFRFPMIFLCGLFIPLQVLPLFLRPLSYILPLTYGTDILKSSISQNGHLGLPLNFLILLGFAVALFALSIRNVKRKWIY